MRPVRRPPDAGEAALEEARPNPPGVVLGRGGTPPPHPSSRGKGLSSLTPNTLGA